MFLDRLGIAIADASFWLIVIGGVVVALRILFRDVVNYLLEETDKKEKSDEE